MKLQSKAEQKKKKDSSSFCSPEKKRIFAEKETFSSIPVDGKCRNADLAGVPDSRVSSYGSSTGTSQESVQETHIRDGRLRENAVWINLNSEIGTQIDFWYILC